MSTPRRSVTFNVVNSNSVGSETLTDYSSRRSVTSSYELRRSHQHVLLMPNPEDLEALEGNEKVGTDSYDEGGISNVFNKSRYSIKAQLMLTYGIVNTTTMILLVVICIVMVELTGSSLKQITFESFDELSKQIQGKATRYFAEDLAVKLIPEDVVQLIYEATQDRFMGYPDAPGYDNDKLVPFRHMGSQSNNYPIIGDPAPLDWEIQPNVNETNYEEHVGTNRWKWYQSIQSSFSTATASYHMQGMCDPSVIDKSKGTYFPMCTKHNNDISTGGVIAPSSTNFQIHRKVSDLTPLFKSLYEYHTEIRNIGLFFVNGGAGSAYHFPHFKLDTNIKYTSAGCDWLLSTPHPLDPSRMILEDKASKERIQDKAKCRPKGSQVSSRIYNPLEREWCRDQAIHPNQVRISGPYLDAFSRNQFLITVGRAIYDKLTSEFIACIAVDFVIDSLRDLTTTQLSNSAQVSIVKYDDMGTIVASSEWDINSQTNINETKTIDQIPEAGISKEAYQSIYSLVDYDEYKNGNKLWNAEVIRSTYEGYIYQDKENSFHVTGYPIPLPPDTFDPDYVPEFIALVSLYTPESEPFLAVQKIVDLVDGESLSIGIISLVAGLVGLGILMVSVLFVSHYLTTPLQYMNDVANDIIENHFGKDDYNYKAANVPKLLTTSLQFMKSAAHLITNTKDVSNFSTGTVESNNLSTIDENNDEIKSNTDPENADLQQINKEASDFAFVPYKPLRCAPKTEIDEVVNQFDKMISQFSSSSSAKTVKTKIKEFKNQFSLENDFGQLYISRFKTLENGTASGPTKFAYIYSANDQPSEDLRIVHHGKNIGTVKDNVKDASDTNKVFPKDENMKRKSDQFKELTKVFLNENALRIAESARKRGYLGSLFFWIMLLTVVPFVIVFITFSVVITLKSVEDFNEIINTERDSVFKIESNALNVFVGHRSRLASSIMERPVRDLHVLTRYAGWLLSNGVQHNDDFIPEVLSNVEQCRFYDRVEDCIEFRERIAKCDCAWNDPRVDPHSDSLAKCHDFKKSDSRDLTSSDSRYDQVPYFVAQSQDTWENGDRNSTSYPNIGTSPQTTTWFPNISSLPGFDLSASGYETTYDRIRILSAIPVWVPLYNQDNYYGTGQKRVRLNIGSYIGFEADGSYMGYDGCAYPGQEAKAFYSIKEIPGVPPNICPDGKYGYDPRCRSWYINGKYLFEQKNDHLYVTPPYAFAGQNFYGQSCSSPLVDPGTGTYIGQLLTDFMMTPLLEAFNSINTPLSDGGFPLLIANDEFNNEDTVIGPNFSFNDPKSVVDLLYANDPNCQDYETGKNSPTRCGRQSFENIVRRMKSGDTGQEKFTLSTDMGEQENFMIAYHPVMVKSFNAIDTSDFSRGSNSTDYLIYSAALVEAERFAEFTFLEIEDKLNQQGTKPFIVIIVVVFLASLCFIFISFRMAASIAEPLLHLLELIGKINGMDSYGGVPEIEMKNRGHSLEVVNVSNTIESLYNVIGSANVAFFSGDLQKAYAVLTDVLLMYRRLDNRKGISIACNNLGNTMLAMYRTLKFSGEDRICGFNKQQIITKGTAYFHEAIQLGEKSYDNFYEAQGWSPVCLEFMQHLSNRYFNRALFLLAVKDDHPNSQEIKELGLRDLEIARDMDLEIVEEGKQAGWGVRTLDKQFEVTLTRARGHLSLLKLGYPDEWEIDELLDEAFKKVRIELLKLRKKSDFKSSLFLDTTPVGRMQQIETQLIRYKILKNDMETAAKIAIRMMVEDEYILLDAHLNAIEALVNYTETQAGKQDGHTSHENRKASILEYQKNILKYAGVQSTLKHASNSYVLRDSIEITDGSDKHGRDQCNLDSSFSMNESSDVTMEGF